jgi:hypothetical protein
MKTTVTVLQILVRIIGPIMIVLGLLFWIDVATTLVPIHMLLGVTLVLLLWTLAVIGAVSRVNLGLVAVALVWGLIVPVLGVTQTQLLPGAAHWLIRTLHLLVGVVAIVLADTLASAIKRRRNERRAQTVEGAVQ